MITDLEMELVSNSSGKVRQGNICVITVQIISQPSTKYTTVLSDHHQDCSHQIKHILCCFHLKRSQKDYCVFLN